MTISENMLDFLVILLCLIRKISKMKYERDTEWPHKFQPAVFAANTQFKRSTSYTPFRLMFGRYCDPFGLIKLITDTSAETEIQEEESIDDGIQV